MVVVMTDALPSRLQHVNTLVHRNRYMKTRMTAPPPPASPIIIHVAVEPKGHVFGQFGPPQSTPSSLPFLTHALTQRVKAT